MIKIFVIIGWRQCTLFLSKVPAICLGPVRCRGASWVSARCLALSHARGWCRWRGCRRSSGMLPPLIVALGLRIEHTNKSIKIIYYDSNFGKKHITLDLPINEHGIEKALELRVGKASAKGNNGKGVQLPFTAASWLEDFSHKLASWIELGDQIIVLATSIATYLVTISNVISSTL